MKRFASWRPSLRSIYTLGIAIITLGLLVYRLGSLTHGLAGTETPLQTPSVLLHKIWNDPIGLPLLVSRLLVASVFSDRSPLLVRLPSALIGLVIVLLIHGVLRRWYGYRLALFGTSLLILSSWFLHDSRLATSDILYPLAMSIVLMLAAWWHQKEQSTAVLYVSAILLGVLFYIPGAVWLIVCLLFIEYKAWRLRWQQAPKKHTLLTSLMTIVLLGPLIHALVRDWHIYKTVLGLPAQLPTVVHFGRQFIGVWLHVFIHGFTRPIYNLGSLPLVNTFITLLFIAGIILYLQHGKASRSKLLAVLALVASLLAALQQPTSIAILLPVVIIVATGGLGYILNAWLRVFPRNPVARAVGIGVVVVTLGLSSVYNLQNYFVAWPHNPDTQATFRRQP